MLFLFLSVLFTLVTSNPYSCTGKHTIDPRDNIRNPYYYPSNWTEGKEPEVYAPNQKCAWKFIVPNGMYATGIFYSLNEIGDNSIYIIYPNGVSDGILMNNTSPYIFTSPEFQVTLDAPNRNGTFSFKVFWSKYPSTVCQSEIQLSSTDIIPSTASKCAITYTSPGKVFLSGLSNSFKMDQFLRQSAIFDGDSINGTFLGTLYDASHEGIYSKGHALTIYTFDLFHQTNDTLFIGRNGGAAKNNTELFAPACYYQHPTDCKIQAFADANSNDGTVSISRNVDYLGVPEKFPVNSTMKIYERAIAEENLFATVNGSNFRNFFPMAVKSSMKLYTIDDGFLDIPLFQNPKNCSYYYAFIGRFIKIHSFDRGILSVEQGLDETFVSIDELLSFNFDVKHFDGNRKATLDIMVSREDNLVFSRRFSAETPPPSTFTAIGDSVTVTYRTYGANTTGFEIGVLCEDKNYIASSSSFETTRILRSSTSEVMTSSTSSLEVTISEVTTSSESTPTSSTKIPSFTTSSESTLPTSIRILNSMTTSESFSTSSTGIPSSSTSSEAILTSTIGTLNSTTPSESTLTSTTQLLNSTTSSEGRTSNIEATRTYETKTKSGIRQFSNTFAFLILWFLNFW